MLSPLNIPFMNTHSNRLRKSAKTDKLTDAKTNEDYNKKKPDPSDPNEVKGKPKKENTDVSDIGEVRLKSKKNTSLKK
jgi:hypothetical protein